MSIRTTLEYTGPRRGDRVPLGGVALLIALAACGGVATARTAGTWSDVPLVGGRAALLPLVGLSPTLPKAVTLGELIEASQYRQDPHNAQLVAMAGYFAAPPAGGDEAIPLPLDPEFWRGRVLRRRVPDRDLVGAILADRQAALLCYGLLGLDQETLAFVAREPALVRGLLPRTGAFAAFAHALHVQSGALVLPGGPAAAPLWEDLIGQPLRDPLRAIPALLDRDNGRLAYMAETAAALDSPHLALLLPPQGTLDDRRAAARTAYRAFVDIDGLRNLSDLVFQRVSYDLAAYLAVLPVSGPGRLAGSDGFWRALLTDDTVPAKGAAAWSDLDDTEPADASRVVAQFAAAALTERRDLIALVSFLNRLEGLLPAATAADRVYLGHAFRRYPALVLTLERLGISDLAVWTALVNSARQIDDHYGMDDDLDAALALLQAPVAFVDRARLVGAVDPATATRLLARLGALDVTDRSLGSHVAAWISGDLLPALGRGTALTDGDAESRLLDGLAGVTTPPGTRDAATVRWEDNSYRVDPAAAEVARLADVRTRQGGNTLDTALQLARAMSTLGGRADDAAWSEARQELDAVRAALVPRDRTGEDRLGPLPETGRQIEDAIRDTDRGGRPSARRGQGIAAKLAPSENALLADALTSITYALWLGDPDGQAFLGGNVARRHDFGRSDGSPAERRSVRWALPVEASGAGEPWHIRGALLALDVGLGRLALRRTSLDMPDGRPTLNEGDRRAFIASLVLMPRPTTGDDGPARLLRWLAIGRQALRDAASNPSTLPSLAARLDLDSRRRQALEWTVAHVPDEAPRLLLLSELVEVGRGAEAAPAGWGPATLAGTGCLCAALPDPPAPHRYIGQPGTGILTARLYDLELTVLEHLAALDSAAEPGPGRPRRCPPGLSGSRAAGLP